MSDGYSTQTCDLTISSGGTTSGEIDLGGKLPVAIRFPAAMTGATVSFTASVSSGGTYRAVYRPDGSLYTVTVTTSAHIILPPWDFASMRWMKVVSASSEGADRSLQLVVRNV